MVNVGSTGVDSVHFDGIDIEAEHFHAITSELQSERKSDVAKADDGYHIILIVG